MPVAEPIVAIPGLPLVQNPPGVASLNVVVKPTQTDKVPVIGAGNGVTVTVVKARQLMPKPTE